MDKYLFLDIDGVLNCRDDFKKSEESCYVLCRKKIEILNRIVFETNCKVVLSSAWRIGSGYEETKKLLKDHGAKFKLIGRTGNNDTRGNEIGDWMQENRVLDDQIAIIDDDVRDMGNLMHRTVKTSFDTGITEEHANQIIELLR